MDVVPSNRKWYRNLVISHVLIDALEGLGKLDQLGCV